MPALLIGCNRQADTAAPAPGAASTPPPAQAPAPERAASLGGYTFERGYPTEATVQKAYDDADLARAITAYKFFYPTVSILATWEGNVNAGLQPNTQMLLLQGRPEQTVFTPNSDTPYAGANLDLSNGPIVVELPAGVIMGVINDLNQRYVTDLGLPGPDAGKGGRHLVLPPGYDKPVPSGYFVSRPATQRALMLLRAIPPAGNDQAAIDLLKQVKIHPLGAAAQPLTWIEQGDKHADFSPVSWERGLEYWKRLHSIIEAEPPFEGYRSHYGELAALGIAKGQPFSPDPRMSAILERAAQLANDQMRVQSFADRRAERRPWADRQWEWATLRPENGTFDTPAYTDLEAREKWFYQAQIESPAMFRRTPGAGSLYWLGTRDATGAYLDGGKTYKLTVPLPVPAKLFWSVTVYDNQTRSEIATEQDRAALRSMFEVKDATGTSVDLFFGPKAPAGEEAHWIQTTPGQGWFVYFRVYGPETQAFNGQWKPSDFVEVK
ncbi:hypothetical protein ARC20_05635 [Stenotrophomonas panacihumi]|uniref:DUF1254 domain-containing protein n=2 Tax=Stenotrophomonas panacihumi TaxID=676599 RepID=A0A0R0AMK6_9GAMM|nr:DUF1254 domain-containing protein [Stenotrophomonas panacihumi]KRG46373.1 hypothetical protein ARC20_05635 [Stenotrophomonas panacihumi]